MDFQEAIIRMEILKKKPVGHLAVRMEKANITTAPVN